MTIAPLSTETRPSAASDVVDPITGRKIRRLTAPPRNNVHAYYDISPWSPDGRRIVYASNLPGETGAEIWIMNADGGDPRPIATHPRFDLHTGCHQEWADDRTVVLAGTQDGQPAMRLIDVETLEERLAPLPGRIDKLSGDKRYGVVTEASREVGIVEMATGVYTRVCTVDQVREMTPYKHLLEGERSALGNPRWSPDGTHLLITHRTVEERPVAGPGSFGVPRLVEMFMYDLPARRFYYLTRYNHHPGWHPNGQEVFFVGRDPNTGIQDLRSISREGGDERIIFDGEHLPAGHPSFHPTNHSLLVTDCYGGRFGFGIILVDLQRQQLTYLASQPLGEDPAIAPEARAADPPNWGSWSYRRSRVNAHPCWQPDGAAVFYADIAAGTAQLHLVDMSDVA